jgi:hypothetical protein
LDRDKPCRYRESRRSEIVPQNHDNTILLQKYLQSSNFPLCVVDFAAAILGKCCAMQYCVCKRLHECETVPENWQVIARGLALGHVQRKHGPVALLSRREARAI